MATAALRQVRAEVAATTQASQNANKSELTMRQQLAAAQSLQRQRSAALIAEWKRAETQAANLAKGVKPVGENLQKVTDIMQGLRGSAAVLEGPLGGVAGRLGSISSLAATLGPTGGPIGIAIVGLAAMTAAAVLLNVKLIELGVSTADWQGKFQDMSQQAGVTVETLSGLEVAFSTTGGNIDTAVQSLIIFQSKMVDAGDASSKTGKLFKELGITSTDVDQALRQAITGLSKIGEEFKRTDAARDLFGRGAKSFLAITKETNGDLDKLIDKLRAMGVLLSGDAAKSADEFNDQLAILQFQLRGVGAVIGREMLPPILSALQSLGKLISDNQAALQLMGSSVRVLIAQPLEAWLKGNFYWLNQLGDALNYVTSRTWSIRYEVVMIGGMPVPLPAGLIGTEKPTFGEAAGAGLGRTDRGPGTPKGGKGKAQKDTSLDDAVKEAQLAEREILQRLNADVEENKRAYEEQARTIEEYTDRAIELADERGRVAIDRINAEWIALQQALAKKTISEKEYSQKKRELDIQTKDAINKNNDEIWEAEQKRDKEKASAEFAAHQRSVQLADEASERLIAIIRDKVDRQIIAESEGEKQIAPLIAEGFDRRKKLLEDELTRLTTSLERKRAINDDLIRLDGERADAAERAARRIADAQQAELPGRPRQIKDATRERRVGPPPVPEEFSIWGEALEAMKERMEEFHEASKTYVVGAFQGMAKAATSAIQAWILYGGSLGKALKQALAAELAHVAAQAAVQAMLHAAYALGNLAFGNFASAAKHGVAAAKFAAVAALTGIAARGLAGSTAASSSGSATASGAFQSATKAGSGSTAGKPTTTDVNRRAMAEPQTLTRTIEFKVKGDALVDKFVEDYNLNGRTRIIIRSDGQG